MSKKFIVGLGNPGSKYAGTRHNAGFRLVEYLAQAGGLSLNDQGHLSVFGRWRTGEWDCFLIEPQTFMNESGKALLDWKRREGLTPESMLVCYDDMDLPLGKVRFRAGGSGGSHNGMASIIESLGTDGFSRLRLGVGKPEDPAEWADYVLKPFSDDEEKSLDQALENAALAAKSWLAGVDTEQIMSLVNGKSA